jgi:hypothetical protein
MGRNLIPLVSKTCGHRQADSGRIKPGSETVNNPDPDSFRPQNQRSRTQNPKQTRPQPPVERGWADKADSRPPLRGPGGWGGDWYVWHAPDGLRARAATGLGCMHAGAEKLGVIEASYASAIIGVVAQSKREWPISPRWFLGEGQRSWVGLASINRVLMNSPGIISRSSRDNGPSCGRLS